MRISADVQKDLGALRLRQQLEVADGERVAIVGPNGVGKTTLIRLLAGRDQVDGRFIKFDDRPVDDRTTKKFVPAEFRGSGYCPQTHVLFPRMNALANVAFGLRMNGISKSESISRGRQILKDLQISDHADSLPHELSAGQSQRVAIGRALAVGQRLLLLDEPTASLDVDARPIVQRVLREYVSGNRTTLLLVTHDRVEAESLTDRVIEIGS